MEPTHIFQVQSKAFPNTEWLEILSDRTSIALLNTNQETLVELPLDDVIGIQVLNDSEYAISLFTDEDQVLEATTSLRRCRKS